ncbi:hypothetical protein ACE6H2_003472 [Prunus campanulata]
MGRLNKLRYESTFGRRQCHARNVVEIFSVISNLIMTTTWQSLGAIYWFIAFALFLQRRHAQNKL